MVQILANTQEPSSVAMLATFAGGWVALLTIGASTTFYLGPIPALVIVSAIGIACSLKGFGGCEMPIAMLVFIVLGVIAIPLTRWAWVAPSLPGGFMLSAVLTDFLWD